MSNITFDLKSEKPLKLVLKKRPEEDKEEQNNYKIQKVKEIKERNGPLSMVLIGIEK